jgi:hypothetical protein
MALRRRLAGEVTMQNDSLEFPLTPPEQCGDETRILLLDANDARRDNRTKALRDRGVQVDCAGNAEHARTLWKPGSHEIVLIEFRNAGEEIHDFHRYACNMRKKQKFGFYVGDPPYLTRSHRQCESVMEGSPIRDSSALAESLGEDGSYRTGLHEAARRIATVRRLTRPATTNSNAPSRGASVSDAMRIANRVLGGA